MKEIIKRNYSLWKMIKYLLYRIYTGFIKLDVILLCFIDTLSNYSIPDRIIDNTCDRYERVVKKTNSIYKSMYNIDTKDIESKVWDDL